KIVMITGAAQGFGLGIAQELITQGAQLILADLNLDGAQANADAMCVEYGAGRAVAIGMDVSNEASALAAVAEAVAVYGGVDVFVSNAGVLRAGSIFSQPVSDFDLVTNVNYRGYFLGVRAVAPVMAAQHAVRPTEWFDIIEINSKSGLAGSKANFAYAGSKFGGIGLTQSFALELVEYGIKVNAICPGNYLDGPLWMDPERGLFVQYLRAQKVPGAASVDDVRRHYEAQVPMRRGCFPADLAKAIYYLVDQDYETGQAVPVTGGQNMLN
ncbi:MAG: SDR family NAD(P)-dependent oxidoreductase, partial [Propionicimonas sp.]